MSEFKYVPVKATNEMTIAASQVGYPLTHQNVLRIWKAMLAAAPTQPSPVESDKEDDLTIAYMYGYHKGKDLLDKEAVRNAALEEAARLVEENSPHRFALDDRADKIRALKSTSVSEVSQPAQPSGNPGELPEPSDSRTEFSDTEMLDWLIAQLSKNELSIDLTSDGKYEVIDRCLSPISECQPQITAREYIKAAMQAEEGS